MRGIRGIAIILVAAVLVAGTTMQVRGQDVFGIIKTLGIGYAVRVFAPQLNNFINTLMLNKGAAIKAQTKVVPILSVAIGISSPGGAYIGAAQVSGPAAEVNKVQAIAQIEANYQTAFRINVLIPVDSLEPWKGLHRVHGVGVSAIIDIKI